MKTKKLLKGIAGASAMLAIVILVGGGAAGALPNGQTAAATSSKAKTGASLGIIHEQFEATGFPTFYEDNISDPPNLPMVGQGFRLKEELKKADGAVIGNSDIRCTIVAIIPAPFSLQFACSGKFTFTNGGTLKVATIFNFDPANLPAMYDAYILSGTGAYAGATGVIHVTDPGPGNPTGYVFNFYHL